MTQCRNAAAARSSPRDHLPLGQGIDHKLTRDRREEPGDRFQPLRSSHWLHMKAGSRWLVLLVILTAISRVLAQEPTVAMAGAKRVEIDKTRQVLRAYEGSQLVLESRISTGKWDRSTPNGHFTAGDKFRMHYSRLYHNAPMPFSVQVTGNVFIHGFTEVPARPASHGCIRLPLDGKNPAKLFFDWVEPGTPIDVMGRWEK